MEFIVAVFCYGLPPYRQMVCNKSIKYLVPIDFLCAVIIRNNYKHLVAHLYFPKVSGLFRITKELLHIRDYGIVENL